MRTKKFDDHNTFRVHFLDKSFAQIRWFLTEFENNADKLCEIFMFSTIAFSKYILKRNLEIMVYYFGY